MKQIKIMENTFRTTLQVFYDCSLEEVHKKYKFLPDFDWFEPRWRYIAINDWAMNIIWLRDINDTSWLVHELVHFIYRVLDWKWIRLNDSTDEVFAYLLEYYYKHILRKIK